MRRRHETSSGEPAGARIRRAARGAVFALFVIAAVSLGADKPTEDWLPLGADLRIRLLARDLWLYESDTQWGDRIVPGNGLIVRGRKGTILVDTPWTEDQTARLLDWVAEELGEPVLGVLGTHFHPDAFGGIAEVHRRGIMTWGHALTGDLAARHDREAPKRTFDDRWSLSIGASGDDGDDLVEAAYLGPGHSPDNFMVWLPARRVLFGGCLVKASSWTGLGYLGDADLVRWPATLRAAEVFDAEMVVPGHGFPGGPELLAHTLGLLERENGRRSSDRDAGPGGAG